MKTQMIHARVDQNLKHNAEQILNALGLNMADAIRLFFTQVILNQGLPFEVKIPNKKTQKAIEELEVNNNLQSYSAKEFSNLLNAQ